MLLEILTKNLQAEGLLVDRRQTHLVVAYSGGIDSTVLLHLMAQLQTKENLKITAAFYNHGWRGVPIPELPILHQNCAALNIPWVIIPADPSVPHTETAAREARYKQLTHLAHDLGADGIVTGHNADDQVETLLFRILRGTGVDGLVGIQKKLVLSSTYGKPVPILRPMLDIYREGIRRYAKEKQLTFFEDPSNQNLKINRNLIRQQVIPQLQERFPQLKNSLLRLSEVAEGDLEIIDAKVDPLWNTIYQHEGLNTILFNQLSLPYQRRLVKRFLVVHDLEFDFQKIDEIIQFIQGHSRKRRLSALKSLEGRDCFLSLYKNRLSLIQIKPAQKTPESTPVTIPGEAYLPSKVLLKVRELTEEEKKVAIHALPSSQSEQIYVDLSNFADKPLELRYRRSGDKIHPLGMPVPMRLKSFLINRGIPRFDRPVLPLMAHGNEILWAAGVGLSEALRVKDQPTHVLSIERVEKPEPTSHA